MGKDGTYKLWYMKFLLFAHSLFFLSFQQWKYCDRIFNIASPLIDCTREGQHLVTRLLLSENTQSRTTFEHDDKCMSQKKLYRQLKRFKAWLFIMGILGGHWLFCAEFKEQISILILKNESSLKKPQLKWAEVNGIMWCNNGLRTSSGIVFW
jgi:hypothetical protein